MNVDDIVVAH